LILLKIQSIACADESVILNKEEVLNMEFSSIVF